ncbi:leguminosin group485 secreted peptide [Medicago truncatula]|uniref:Leguminosin group485 secreted peptide n=1 Tax=Medicago truncatula TaxID=3880 RepID=A0A072TT80_MEDTR|nr:leguminosin group485 secreted peptide [Medicago truncatula]
MAPNKSLIILFILVVTLSSMIMSFEARHLLEEGKKPDMKALIEKFLHLSQITTPPPST